MTGAVRARALLIAVWACSLAWSQQTSLDRIRAVPEMAARAKQALDFAVARLDAAAQAFKADDPAAGRLALDDVGAAVELAVESLDATGKHPRRNPRHFKNAEIRTRRMLGQIRQLRLRAYQGDQPDFDRLIERVEAGNRKLLLGIMSPKK